MTKFFQKEKVVVGILQAIGYADTVGGVAITVIERDGDNLVSKARGITVPSGVAGYALECEFVDTDKTSGTHKLYRNIGTTSSCTFDLVGEIGAADITDESITLTDIADNALLGKLNIRNDTGGTLTVGTLVRVNGYDSTNGLTADKADADANAPATHFVAAEILNAASGDVQQLGVLTGYNTGGRTIGDPVYLDPTTAGGLTFTAPTGADQVSQQVGVVKVVHASTGEVYLFPGLFGLLKFGTSFLQDLAISTAKIATNAVTGAKIPNAAIGTLAHLDLAAVVVDHADASPKEILAADADQERLALVMIVATEAAAGDPDIDIGVASDTNSVVDDFGAGAWAVGDRLVRLVRIPAGDNLRATIAAAGTAGAMDVFVHVLTLNVNPANLAVSEALIATADGLTTGLMSGLTSHAVVTSAAATNAITLPASSAALVGKTFTIWVGANGFELLTPAASNATINGTDSDGTNQADIPANSLSRLTLVDTNTWILENIGSTGTVAAAIVPDND